MYFNITSNTFKIWTYTVLFAIALYESVRYLLRLYLHGKLRFSMFILFACVLYPHYYTWWMIFNYLNDDYYYQWYHQMFFSITELVSTAMVLYLCDKSRPATPSHLLLVIATAVLHILASGGDQFVRNVIMGRGQMYQIYRDIGFMLPDVINIMIPAYLWVTWCRSNNTPLTQSITRAELGLACISVAMLWALCSAL